MPGFGEASIFFLFCALSDSQVPGHAEDTNCVSSTQEFSGAPVPSHAEEPVILVIITLLMYLFMLKNQTSGLC